MFERSFDRTERINQITEEINHAIRNAPTKDELDAFTENETQVVADFLQGKINKEEFDLKSQKLALSRPSGVVKFNLLPDFIDAVHIAGVICRLTPLEMKRMIAHENDHRARAVQFGLPSSYTLEFAQGSVWPLVRPSVEATLLDSLTEEERVKVMKEMLNAPERLSQYDLDMLGPSGEGNIPTQHK